MMVLDTHALVWWVSAPEKIPPRARRLLDKERKSGSVIVSSISVWEIAMLVERGRLELTIAVGTWISAVEALSFLRFMPVDNRVALRAVGLAGFPHGDPADRIITATALAMKATLVTADRRLRAYDPLDTLWD